MYASDRAANGQFLTGVLSTGIYCLPSCNARKPKAENVTFFRTEQEAQEAGLRACRRCKPDAFYRNQDPDREQLQALASRLRKEPHLFAGVPEMAQETQLGQTKLNALFRQHYHTTPAQFLNQARIDAACQLLADPQNSGTSPLEIAYRVGYESLSTFHENFRKQTGMSPNDYRKLGREATFVLALPAGYRTEYPLRAWGRDTQSRIECVRGNHLTKAIHADQAALLHIEFQESSVICRVETENSVSPSLLRTAHEVALRLLGYASDPLGFQHKIEGQEQYAPLLGNHTGLRIPLTATVFEALTWAIIGQQINLSFAFSLRRALAELCGTPLTQGFLAHPTPEQVANLEIQDLTKRQFSQRKAEYLLDTARLIVEGDLTLEPFQETPVTQIEKRLLAVRGLGVWSVNYILMRGYGFADCVPLGDTGIRSALRRLFSLEETPTIERVATLMEPFAPYRSLATYHLWMLLGDPA
jgi:AraC family transcriptional regulator of adaptative response / DNA-3-methyladenine glycosylase II